MNVLIVYYSMYGNIRRMTEAVKEGADGVSGAAIKFRQRQAKLLKLLQVVACMGPRQ
jgi:multimeric flavodoxin WrbA